MNRRPGSTGVMVFRGISARRSGTHRKWSRSRMSTRAGDGSPLHASPPHVHRPPGLPTPASPATRFAVEAVFFSSHPLFFSKEWSQFTIDITDLIRTSVFRYLYNSSIMNTFNEFTNGTSPYETKLSRAHGAHSRG